MSSLVGLRTIFISFTKRNCPTVTFYKVRTCSTNSDQNTQNEPKNDAYESDIRFKILKESLKFVPEKGWSKEAISSGAEVIGYPGVVHGLFPRAGADLVNFFQTESNSQLVKEMKELQKNELAPVVFVEKAIQLKLLSIVPYKSRWPQAIAIMSLPPNVPTALASLLTLVDDICYYAGDRSVDFNWYARRIGIAGVYKASELYLIQDSSSNQEKTFEFLHKRLLEAVQIHDLICKSESTTSGTKDSIISAFVTARNILGLNWNR